MRERKRLLTADPSDCMYVGDFMQITQFNVFRKLFFLRELIPRSCESVCKSRCVAFFTAHVVTHIRAFEVFFRESLEYSLTIRQKRLRLPVQWNVYWFALRWGVWTRRWKWRWHVSYARLQQPSIRRPFLIWLLQIMINYMSRVGGFSCEWKLINLAKEITVNTHLLLIAGEFQWASR